jgi:serine/threonine protein kinase
MRSQLEFGQKAGAGRFTLVKPLGRGGMGEVWLARDERLQEQVALKFLPSEIRGDPVALDDLGRETSRSHKLSHPNIVRIHDLHEDSDGTAFIVMECVDGPTLAALRLQQPNQVFAWSFLRPLLEQLCAALDYAHGEKVIHRDLKPANLMVDSRGRLKLADFGIAAAATDSMTRVSTQRPTSGTLRYMSPQQLAGKRPQATDDVYALGATLYELLTSKPPFYTGDLTHQILHEPPEPMEERLAALGIENEIPWDVAALIMACLAKEPAQRPQSALALAEWIGLEMVRKPSLTALGKDVFSGVQSAGKPLVTPEIETVPPARPSSGKKSLWVAGAVTASLLLAAGGWYWAKQTHGKKPAPSALGLDQSESWTFTTIAGKAGSRGSKDGIGSDAQFSAPNSIAVNKEGNLYVAEWNNSTIRLIKPSGAVSTLPGLAQTAGSSDGTEATGFRYYHKIAMDRSGNAYVADNNNHTIQKITPSGMVTTFAGQAGRIGNTDGPASIARFHYPRGIAVEPDGNIFVADTGNNTIRRITPDGVVSTLAGQAGVKGSMDGLGPMARFDGPAGIAVGARGFIYVTDSGNNTVRAINPSGMVSTLAGQPGVPGSSDGVSTNAQFNSPRGIAVDGEGNLYVADTRNDTIRKITSAGVVTTIGGLAGKAGSSDGAGAYARFRIPIDIALDAQENIYVTDEGNHTVRKGHRQQIGSESGPKETTGVDGGKATHQEQIETVAAPAPRLPPPSTNPDTRNPASAGDTRPFKLQPPTLHGKPSGHVLVWGRGSGNHNLSIVPAGMGPVVAISGGGFHNLALTPQGKVWAWGAGTVNTGTNDNFGQSMVPPALDHVVAISAGWDHSLALRQDGTVIGWGADGFGQTDPPADLTNAVAIAAGAWLSVALTSDGSVRAWGGNHFGQTNVPPGLNHVIGIASGWHHILALRSDGTVVAWGAGETTSGQTPMFGQAIVPAGLKNVIAIAAGRTHSAALEADGTVVVWGGESPEVRAVPPITKVVAISANGRHTLALQRDGTVSVWGQIGAGQNRVPRAVNHVIAIAAGNGYSLALTTNP